VVVSISGVQALNPNDPKQFFVFFIFMWIAVGLILAQVGGWAELARHYRPANPFEGRMWRFRSGHMRLTVHYNNVLTVGASPEGLYLAVLFLFRVGHPPLLVPWKDISTTTGKTLLWRWAEFRFQQAPYVWIRFYGKLGDEILSSSKMLSAMPTHFIQA
jgi:hypothetical protein